MQQVKHQVLVRRFPASLLNGQRLYENTVAIFVKLRVEGLGGLSGVVG